MKTLREVIKYAKENPNDPRNVELFNGLKDGVFDKQAEQENFDISKVSPNYAEKRELETNLYDQNQKTNRYGLAGKVARFLNIEDFGEGVGSALGSEFVGKKSDEILKSAITTQTTIFEKLKEAESNKDFEKATKLKKLLDFSDDTIKYSKDLNDGFLEDAPTNKEFIGSSISLLALAGSGKLADLGTKGAIKLMPYIGTEAGTVAGGIIRGGLKAGAGASTVGAVEGLGMGLSNDQDIATSVGIGAGLGLVGGGLFGGIAGGLGSKNILNRASSDSIDDLLSARASQFDEMSKPEVLKKAQETIGEQIDVNKIKKEYSDLTGAGIQDLDAKLIATSKQSDKKAMAEMMSRAENATVDPRAKSYPVDVVGENFLTKVKPLQALQKKFGVEVDTVAKNLKGKQVDSTPLKTVANDLTSELDVFDLTPSVRREVENVIDKVGSISDDGYDIHVLKKQIDSLIDYGKESKGLTGKAQSMLRTIRTSADDLLDEHFADYKLANDNFRKIQGVLDETRSILGKKDITTSKATNAMRSLLSNKQNRTAVDNLLAKIDAVAGDYGVANDMSLFDQVRFANSIENLYGTQAVYSLQGEVQKAVQGATRIAQGLRNPIAGAGELLAGGVERIAGITDESKKKALLKALNIHHY